MAVISFLKRKIHVIGIKPITMQIAFNQEIEVFWQYITRNF